MRTPTTSLKTSIKTITNLSDTNCLEIQGASLGKLHVNSKRYTQRIERHNLNLRQHLARLGRKSLSFSKSVELHDKVIGHYLNIKHYQ
ncbi:hypothetical protein B6I84_25590 [Klebsiella pneumoniae]|nr:hypothetical protein B6I84_25590 [Klebsiella pneumoniae]